MSDHSPGVSHERAEELVLRRCQMDLGPCDEYLAIDEVHAQLVQCEDRRLAASARLGDVPQGHANPRQQLPHAEGLVR